MDAGNKALVLPRLYNACLRDDDVPDFQIGVDAAAAPIARSPDERGGGEEKRACNPPENVYNETNYILKKYKSGVIPIASFSDIVRTQLLIKYGGTWTDASFFCTGRKFEYIMHLPFFAFQFPKNHTLVADNGFMVANKNHPILRLTRDLLFKYWEDYNYCNAYIVFYFFFRMATEIFKNEWEQVPFFLNAKMYYLQHEQYNDYSEQRMKELSEIIDFHRLTYKMKKVPSEKSFYNYVINNA